MAESDFGEYVQARAGGLLRLAYLMCGNPHTAEDTLSISSSRSPRQSTPMNLSRWASPAKMGYGQVVSSTTSSTVSACRSACGVVPTGVNQCWLVSAALGDFLMTLRSVRCNGRSWLSVRVGRCR
jgi:hypothetical protein